MGEPFWNAAVQNVGGQLTEELLIDAMIAMYWELHMSQFPGLCSHLEIYPGWARHEAESGKTEISCPWCGARCALPPLRPRRPPVPDAAVLPPHQDSGSPA